MTTSSIRLLKTAAFEVAQRVGVNAFMRKVFQKRLVVLCYHSIISDDTPLDPRTNIAVTRSQFEQQLQELSTHYTPVSADHVFSAYYHGHELPTRAVLVTFDDGYRNNLYVAAPLLLKYKVPAIFFVTTGHIGTDRLLWTHEIIERIIHCPDQHAAELLNGYGELPSGKYSRFQVAAQFVERYKRCSLDDRMRILAQMQLFDLPALANWKYELYKFMTWTEVCTLRDSGFTIGAHTVDHPILSSLTDEAVERQLVGSKQTIELALGMECSALAYPYGGSADLSANVIEQAKLAGFRLGFTLGGSPPGTQASPLAIERLCITRDITLRRFQARIAGL